MLTLVRKRPGLLVSVWTAVIFLLCAFPGDYIPSANWLDLLSVDKLIHAGIFFVLCFLFIGYAVKNGKRRFVSVFVFAAMGYGIALEFMQGYCFRNRSLDWKDMVANSIGCVVAYLLIKKITRFFESPPGTDPRVIG
jgi:VanZ family protein